jgi:hypothetical protein
MPQQVTYVPYGTWRVEWQDGHYETNDRARAIRRWMARRGTDPAAAIYVWAGHVLGFRPDGVGNGAEL